MHFNNTLLKHVVYFINFSKANLRHVLRRLPINLSPGGTPKGGRLSSAFISDHEDLTPVLTRALLKRFDAFHFSPDENKENDVNS